MSPAFRIVLVIPCVLSGLRPGTITVDVNNNGAQHVDLMWTPQMRVNIATRTEWSDVKASLEVGGLKVQRGVGPLSESSFEGANVCAFGGSDLGEQGGGLEGLQNAVWGHEEPTLPSYILLHKNKSNREHIISLASGGTFSLMTWPGHEFFFEADGLTSSPITVRCAGSFNFTDFGGIFEVAHDCYVSWESIVADVRHDCESSFAGYTADIAHFCSERFDQRIFVKSRFEQAHEAFTKDFAHMHSHRKSNIERSKEQLSSFTSSGFEVQQAPPSLIAAIQSHYYQQRANSSFPEGIDPLHPPLSGRESETWKLELPEALWALVYEVVKPIVAHWSGLSEESLVLTSWYGLRLYHKPSVLHPHVDKGRTHVLSAILEVANLCSTNVSECKPWPLQITDHFGVNHDVPDQAGQLILYESAICAHGRPSPFPNREFAALYVHFAPVGWSEDFDERAKI